MNRREWKESCNFSNDSYYWYNKVRKLLSSREFELLENCDTDARVIHHLRDTEEQRKYNDEHYELFGFEIDENGNEHFEYGKYVVFWTKEHHNEYHRCSEETRARISNANKGRTKQMPKWSAERKQKQSIRLKEMYSNHPEIRQKLSESGKGKHSGKNNAMYGRFGKDHPKYGHSMSDAGKDMFHSKRLHHVVSDETKEKISKSLKNSDKHPWRGRSLPDYIKQKLSYVKKNRYHPYRGSHLSEEHRNNISNGLKGHTTSDETKLKISDSLKGHTVSNETRKKISDSRSKVHGKPHTESAKKAISDKKRYVSEIYHRYKNLGGSLSWNSFNKYFSVVYSKDDDSFNLEFIV